MKRKKSSGGGGANWMDTYGDMVTLLLCFFVLLYSMSTISEENWKNLVMSFNPKAALEIHATPGGEGPSADGDQAGIAPTAPEDLSQNEQEMAAMQAQIEADIEALFQALVAYVSQGDHTNNISVTKGDGKVFISFSDAVFFDPDEIVLRQEAYPILDNISQMLSDAAASIDEVRVIGHTAQASPDRPNLVKGDREISSGRATSVVIYVQEHSEVDPARLISEGVGQWRPVASNETEAGREKNRRVEMVISGRNLEEELQGEITHYEIEEQSELQ